MERIVVILLAILEFIFYTFTMVLVGSITISQSLLKLLVHFATLTITSILLYFFIRFLLNKIHLKSKKYINQVCLWNIVLGILFPILLIIIIPNEKFTIFAILLIVCTLYYGLFVNICLLLLNFFLTNRKK